MAKTDIQYDVIVIGAGIAGLVAANRAAQLGKRVIILEKSKEDKYLCNSRYTYGTFHINFTDVAADEDVLFDKIEACTEGFARKDLARAIAKDGRRLMQWLKSEGIDLVDLGGYQTSVLAPPWRKGFGLTWRGYAGDVALARLEENLAQRQGRILRGHASRAKSDPAAALNLLRAELRLRRTRPKAPPHSIHHPSSSPTAASRPTWTWFARTFRRRPKNFWRATAAPRPAMACVWRRRSALRAPASACFTAICTAAMR